MTRESPATLMRAAADVARLAGDTALRFYRNPKLEVEHKPDGSPVTPGDRDAERVARDWIASRFPSDGILGEEFGMERPDASRRWILDPIDGTKTFIRGVPLWGTLVGVLEGDEVVAGAAYFPAVNELACAGMGEGAWVNDSVAMVSLKSHLNDALALTTDEQCSAAPERLADWERLRERAWMSRTWGDCYGYLLVATGRAEVMVDPILSAWDAAALMPIIEEAGGVFTDWSGVRRMDGGSAVATNSALAREARAALRGETG